MSLSEKAKEYSSRSAKERRQRLKDSGLCVVCGKKPPVDGSVKCQGCKDKQAQTHVKRRLERASLGLCRCGKPRVVGRASCGNCLDSHRRGNKRASLEFSARVGNYFENVCQICGEHSTDYEMFDVHHLDPCSKDTNISKMRYLAWATVVVPELEKCAYLCSNCHRRLHHGRFDTLLGGNKELVLIPGKKNREAA